MGPDRRRIASLKTVNAVAQLAAAEPSVAIRPDAFDADPKVINTPGGVIDLQTGETFSSEPSQLMTKMTGTSAGGECPLWRRTITEITGSDPAMADYLQRIAGYCLTGLLRL